MVEGGVLHEARALLRQFTQSGFRTCHVKTGDVDLYFSRDFGLRASELAPAEMPAEGDGHSRHSELLAPHIGTVIELAPVGTPLAPGAVFGKLAVLHEERSLVADSAGVIDRHCCATGDLIEYGRPVVVITT